MTRTLPWLKNTSTTPSTRRLVVTPRTKSQRIIEPSSGKDAVGVNMSPDDRTLMAQACVGSMSPPPEPPSESFMEEGLEKDDKFRMVEDEFLGMARQFTQHLHTAEFQRMRKAARSQNSATINSISRPVSTKMRNETRRKVDGVERLKKQARVIRSVLSRRNSRSGSDEASDDTSNPWVGTTLYDLMESPRRSTASLSKVSTMKPTTKAAAGFHKPRRPRKFEKSPLDSPLSPLLNRSIETRNPQIGYSTLLDDVDDDLDAPIRPLNLPTNILSSTNPPFRAAAEHAETFLSKSVDFAIKGNLHEAIDRIALDTSPESISRIEKRRQARLLKTSMEQKPHEESLDAIIPTFL